MNIWEERARLLGRYYVAHNGRRSSYNSQAEAFSGPIKAAMDLLPPTARVLDFGCGGGRFTRLIAGQSRWYVGVDISPSAISLAKASVDPAHEARCTFQVCRDWLPTEEVATFDAVVAVTTIQHLNPAEWRWVSKSLSAALKPCGLMLIIDATENSKPSRPEVFPRRPPNLLHDLGLQPHAREVWADADGYCSHWVILGRKP